MTPNRAKQSIGASVVIDEGTPFEYHAMILGVRGMNIVCHDGVRYVYPKYNRVKFEAGRITDAEIETFWMKEERA